MQRFNTSPSETDGSASKSIHSKKILKHNMLTKALIAERAAHLNANHGALNEEQMHYTLSNELQAWGSNE